MLLKMDIEGAEFALLPHLLTTGALCALTHLRVEFHLNSLPPRERLDGVALRLGLRHLLRRGCPPAAGIVVEAEEWRPINFGEPVPGLAEEAARHMPRLHLGGELAHGGMPLGIAWNLSVRKFDVAGRMLFTTSNTLTGEEVQAYKALGRR